MASLRETKTRIGTVKTTLKITSAMKMVAAAKLHKAQKVIEDMLPYEQNLRQILLSLLKSDTSSNSIEFFSNRPILSVALVCFSSSSSLCGAFNANVIKHVNEVISSYKSNENIKITVYCIGRKVFEGLRKINNIDITELSSLYESRSYSGASKLSEQLVSSFLSRKYDRVELIYPHLKSTSSQPIVHQVFLPLSKEETTDTENDLMDEEYILEPDRKSLVDRLLPKYLNIKIFSVLLDAVAAEHAARTVAMQMASDNGDDLLHDLTLEYNKGRQQKITNELMDIAGGNVD